ncbi:peptidase inhibitor family I36 protein [Streptosporangium soli]|nr:peptidase inhibitor family I36 protein [Streptosporangium sp. KLBMP 9127]
MRSVILFTVAAFTLAGLSVPAQARSAAPSDCPSGNVCLYAGTGGTGRQICKSKVSGEVVCLNARSAYNHGVSDPGKNDVRLYDLGGALVTCVKRGQVKNLPGPGGYANVFSVKWGTC